jgi:hypothetical protein
MRPHKGTDIAPDRTIVETLDIVAAAAGRVIGTGDGLDDTPIELRAPDRDSVRCGNGVRIDHGGGWTTQYCHMARGSVTVSKGATADAGDKLGQIGSSGWSELPHLHFQLEVDGGPVDPFLGRGPGTDDVCVASRGQSTGMWVDAGPHNASSYQPVRFRTIGLTTAPPTREQAKYGGYPDVAPPNPDALVAYAVLFGAPSGARITTRVEGPAGGVMFNDSRVLDRDFAEYFFFAGQKRGNRNWPAGVYTARLTVSGEGAMGDFEVSSESDLILR